MKTHQTRLERLASDILEAAVHIRPQMLKDLLEKVEDKDVDAIVRLLGRNGTFDLVSILGVILKDYGQWMDSVTMHRRRSDNYAQMDLILEYLGVVLVSDFPQSQRMYAFTTGCDDDTDDEILDNPKKVLLDRGVREIDIDLYIATCRLDYDRARMLLQRGADPEATVGDDTAMDMVHTVVECNQLELYDFLSGDGGTYDSATHMRIIEMGGHEQMLQLFNKYHRDPALDEWRRSAADGPKELRFLFDYPEVGWSDMHVLIDGQHAMMLNLSDIYDPFPHIWEWIGRVRCSHSAETVIIDCEHYTAQLCFTPDPDGGEYGSFSMTDDSGADDGFCVRTRKDGLLDALEHAIRDFMKECVRWIEYNNEFGRLRRPGDA